jgi:hypothetical protein
VLTFLVYYYIITTALAVVAGQWAMRSDRRQGRTPMPNMMLGAFASPILLPLSIVLVPVTWIVLRRIRGKPNKAKTAPSNSPLHSQKIGPVSTPEDARLVAAYEAAMREKRRGGQPAISKGH